jgi:glycosyltransferase involved in cell wall biosynthesis
MANVLHLLDADADFQSQRLAAALTHNSPATCATVGPGRKYRDVWNAARWLKRRPPVDLLHAWGTRPLIAAAMADIAPIIFTPPSPLDDRGLQWLKRISKRRDVQVICDSMAARTSLCLRGVSLDKCATISPGVDARPRTPRDESRRKLGMAENDFVILAPGESTRGAGHRLSLWTAAILYELSNDWKLLLWGRGTHAVELDRMAEQLDCLPLLQFRPDEEFEDLLSAADAALITADADAASLPLALCMAAGLPIVATPLDPLTDRQNALVAADRSSRTLAQDLLELRSNPELRKSLAESARRDAQAIFDVDNFRRAHADLYNRKRRGLRTED